ncbi:hypothetical protein like AT1G48660 [Hibiscus trionum]|uniref:Indole-3-acetic acid-amido synthetase GH3.6 n=1 Tax=Hibiscus trionum TaxID=183268 RepID=A0A9W7LT00_HIBTR|nr:hypothetical protein like AT1G48660 [Hibiscus trionum]
MTDDALLKQIDESTKAFSRHQDDTLRSILQHQCGVHYLQRYLPDIGDHSLTIDAATFRRSVPLFCYDDYVRIQLHILSGSMKQYYSKLKYYAGEVPLVGGDYFSSECCVAINLDIKQPPDQTRFVMLPTASYFEFLPFDSTENNVVGEETVDACGVEVGKMYEVVVTTYRGFYRYRLGDIVRVVGFYNSSPLLEFVMRAPKASYEIVTEGDLMAAMETFQLVLRNTMGMAIEIMEFTSSVEFGSSPKRQKIFIELKDCNTSLQNKLRESMLLLKECCAALEDDLGSIYKVQRNKGEISPLSLSILKCGNFDRLLKLAIENGTPASQYKPPKIIRNPSIVGVLEEYVLVNITLD